MRVERVGYAEVKGTRHLARDQVELTEQGVLGDRRWCFVDVAGRSVLRTVRQPGLMAVRAESSAEGSLVLRAPGLPEAAGTPELTGETVTGDYWGRSVPLQLTDGPHAALLALVGRPVRLAAAPPGGVVYAGAVSVVAAESLAALSAALGAPVGGARFRPTLVLRTGAAPYAEEQWAGRELRIGGVLIRLVARTPRCAVVGLDPATGRRDLPVLRLLSGRPPTPGGEPGFGLDGDVLRAGRVAPGDLVQIGGAG